MQYTISIDQTGHSSSDKSSTLVGSFFHLTHLLKAGVGIDDALVDIVDMERGHRRSVWRQVSTRVQQGSALSAAMAAIPTTFDTRVTALIQAGECSGDLASACHGCMRLLQWQAGVKSRLTTVLVYPLFALTITSGVAIFLLTYMVPAMGGFLTSSAVNLTWHARALLALSDWLLQYVFLLPVLLALVTGMVTLFRRLSTRFRLFADALLLEIPFIGSLTIHLEMSRYCNTCAHLYGAGVALSDSMLSAEAVVANRALRRWLQRSRSLLISGETLSTSLRCVPVLPGMVRRLLSAGESAGVLEQALMQASQQQQQLTTNAIERGEKLLAPALLLIMGMMLFWIVTSLLGPVYESAINTVLSS